MLGEGGEILDFVRGVIWNWGRGGGGEGGGGGGRRRRRGRGSRKSVRLVFRFVVRLVLGLLWF